MLQLNMASNHTQETCLFLEIQDVSGKPMIKFTAIATSAIGLLSSFGSIFGNALLLYVIAKFDRLQLPSNILLANLCVTDLITGLLVVPTISIRRITEAYGHGICAIRLICAYFSYLTVIVSIVTVGMVSGDRCFAIMRPFRYQRTVTNARYLITIVITWLVLGAYSGLPFLRVLSGTTFFKIALILMSVAIGIFVVCYLKISKVAKTHRRRLQPMLNTSQRSETMLPDITAKKSIDQHTVAASLHETVQEMTQDVVDFHSQSVHIKTDFNVLPNEGVGNQAFHREFSCENTQNSKAIDPSRVSMHEAKFGSKVSMKSINIKGLKSTTTITDKNGARKQRFDFVENNQKDLGVNKHGTGKEKGYNLNKGEQKRANTIAILVFAAVLCYGPLAIIYVLRALCGDTFELVYLADPWADLMLYINSMINPIIYCLRGKEFRDAVKKVLPRCLLIFCRVK